MKKQILLFLMVSVFTIPTISQKKPGKKKESFKGDVENIAKIQATFDKCFDRLKQDPDDVGSLFVLSMAYSCTGQQEKAVERALEALDKGLPLERFLSGPKNLFTLLYEHPEFKALSDAHHGLVNGAILGAVTHESAKVWVRTWGERQVQVQYSESADMQNAVTTTPITTNNDDDLTAVVDLIELEPATDYYYEILLDGNKVPMSPQPSFTTNPVSGDKGNFKIAFGGGAGYMPKNERIWDTLAVNDLTAFLALGDNVYIDRPESPEAQRYCYYQRQCRPEYNRFTASTPQYAIYDDHDFAVNDYAGTTAIDSPAWKLNVLEVFKQNFNNPSYGLGEENPGCHHKISIGDVDFFMLDCRFYREDPAFFRVPTMLGKEQRMWLLKELKQSKATFKVIVSSVPFTPGVKLDNPSDTWDGFKQERARIFSFIERRRIEGVFLVSADRHRSDARKIHRPHGYDLYEFESSKLTNRHSHDLVEDIPGSTYLFGYKDKCSFGLLNFNTELEDPEVEFQIVSIDNEVIDSVVVKRSELKHCKKKKHRAEIDDPVIAEMND